MNRNEAKKINSRKYKISSDFSSSVFLEGTKSIEHKPGFFVKITIDDLRVLAKIKLAKPKPRKKIKVENLCKTLTKEQLERARKQAHKEFKKLVVWPEKTNG